MAPASARTIQGLRCAPSSIRTSPCSGRSRPSASEPASARLVGWAASVLAVSSARFVRRVRPRRLHSRLAGVGVGVDVRRGLTRGGGSLASCCCSLASSVVLYVEHVGAASATGLEALDSCRAAPCLGRASLLDAPPVGLRGLGFFGWPQVSGAGWTSPPLARHSESGLATADAAHRRQATRAAVPSGIRDRAARGD